MIGTLLNGMITLTLSKFILNDIPHAVGLGSGKGLGRPKTEAERSAAHYAKYGTTETPIRGTEQRR